MKYQKLRKSRFSSLLIASAVALTGCGGKNLIEGHEVKVNIDPTIVTQNSSADAIITDGDVAIKVLGAEALKSKISTGQLTSKIGLRDLIGNGKVASDVLGAGPVQIKEDSLYIQIPVSLIGQGHIFGGVITAVSNHDDPSIGGLKLTDLPPMNVRPLLMASADGTQSRSLVLVGCQTDCSETSQQLPLLALPVVAQSTDSDKIVVDVAEFGETLNLMTLLDPDGSATGLKSTGTRTTAVDMSGGTIVWDVEHQMVPVDSVEGFPPVVTLITARYYLKLEASLNSSFVARKQVEGVGFFTTAARAEQLITRFSQTEFNGAPVHYFIKNVPLEYQAHFAEALDTWNRTFTDEIGHKVLSYEFVSVDDPKNPLLVAGDVRFNIIEWDLVDKAGYGGLGPSIASQATGEIFSANILVQGPTIESIYKKWFNVIPQIDALMVAGNQPAADALLIATRHQIFDQLGEGKTQPTQSLSFGTDSAAKLRFRHNAQDDRLKDRAAARTDFFETPQGYTYDSYMHGYFIDLVAHEMGHNLGLRHNFKGNLLATADGSRPSGSVMEYLNKNFRHIDTVGEYDHMAIKYGYSGVEPGIKNTFCTDEDVISVASPSLSAECSRDDATNDPFNYNLTVLDRALDRLVAPTVDTAPTWVFADLAAEVSLRVTNNLLYAPSAATNSKTWLNWKKEGRPVRAKAISNYVLKTLHKKLCAVAIRRAPDRKATAEAKDATLKNLSDLDSTVAKIAESMQLGTSLSCSP